MPLARVIAQHQAKLPRLFKRYQIQPVWRADRPARGRFREFYQCDVDALGSTSPVVEAELCAAVSDALAELGFNDFVIRLNHRAAADVAAERGRRCRSRCTARRWSRSTSWTRSGRDGVAAELARARRRRGDAALRRVLEAVIGADVADGELRLRRALRRRSTSAGRRRPFENLRDDRRAGGRHARPSGASRFDPSLARGLSYYTGAIMEINVADLAGSLGGGGRYDNLVGMFLGPEHPGLRVLARPRADPRGDGGARACSRRRWRRRPADVMVAVFDAAGRAARHARWRPRCAPAGLRVLVYPDADKIGKQIKYADARGIPFVAILGGDEIAAGTVTVKNLAAQTQTTYDQAAAGAAILEALKQRG